MDSAMYYCPLCATQVLFDEGGVPGEPASVAPPVPQTMYCPQCEMLVNPVAASVALLDGGDPSFKGVAPENEGRSRADGTNAGGAQRGDLSDEGAALWRRDTSESGHDTWRDKP